MKREAVATATFTAVLCAFVTVLLILAMDLGRVSRLVPVAVAVPTLLVLLFELVLEGKAWLMPRRTEPDSQSEAVPLGGNPAPTVLWILGLVLLVLVFGFVVAFPAFSIAYIRIRAREPWTTAVVVAAAMWGLVHVFFGMLLDVPMYAGQLQIWLGL